jgi:hypothetical protein
MGEYSKTVDDQGRKIAESADKIRSDVDASLAAADNSVKVGGEKVISDFESLVGQLVEAGSAAAIRIQTGLDAVKAGAYSLNQLTQDFGGYVVEIDGHTKQLSSVFAGLNLQQYIQDLQGFAAEIRKEHLGITEISKGLTDLGGEINLKIADQLKKFQEQKLSLQDLTRFFQGLIEIYGETSDLKSLLDSIGQELLKDGNAGFI